MEKENINLISVFIINDGNIWKDRECFEDKTTMDYFKNKVKDLKECTDVIEEDDLEFLVYTLAKSRISLVKSSDNHEIQIKNKKKRPLQNNFISIKRRKKND